MEGLNKIMELQKKRMGIYEVKEDKSYSELVEDIHAKLKELEKNQRHQLTEQEKLTYRMMNTEELLKVVLDNQLEVRESLNKIIERLD